MIFNTSRASAEVINNVKVIFVFCIFVIFPALYSPMLGFLFLILILFTLSYLKLDGEQSFLIFNISGFLLSVFLALIAASQPLFLHEAQDFTTYYNNYLDFYYYGFSFEFFEFGSGYEVGLPTLNYILSVIIDKEAPYLVLFSYALLQSFLLVLLVRKICIYFSLESSKSLAVLALMFLFFKFPTTLNHLRQGFSSFFVLLAIFSIRNYKVYFYFFAATFFHSSAFVIFFVVKLMIFGVNKRKFLVSTFFVLFLSVSIYFLIPKFLSLFSGYQLIGKVLYGFINSGNDELILNNLVKAVSASFYIISLIAFNIYMFYKAKSIVPKYTYGLALAVVSIFSFFYLPGIVVRAFSPLLFILTGYFFFDSFFSRLNIFKSLSIVIVYIIFIFLSWFRSPVMFYNYPFLGGEPFYYYSSLNEEKGWTNRRKLPLPSEVKISTDNQSIY